MAWGLFKKIRDGFKKAGRWVNNNVIKPAVNFVKNPDNIKKIIDTGTKLAPLIGGAVSTGLGGNPMSRMKAGHVVQGIGNNFGFGVN